MECNKVIVRELANGRNAFVSKCSSSRLENERLNILFDEFKRQKLTLNKLYEVSLLKGVTLVYKKYMRFEGYYAILNEEGFEVNQLQFGVT